MGNEMKTFVIGDIHGNYRALMQCLERSKFDYENDRLISLGDVVDGWPDVKLCIDELLKIKKCYLILGNHDYWALEWYDRELPHLPTDIPATYWSTQGGEATMKSYGYEQMPESHLKFLKNWLPWIEMEKTIFIHGGFDPNQKDPTKWLLQTIIWDRDLLTSAWKKHLSNPGYKFGGWDEIFVGHTTTQAFGRTGTDPLHVCNVWDLDTGAGWNGKLTIMDIETHEAWQSDLATILYPEVKGRR